MNRSTASIATIVTSVMIHTQVGTFNVNLRQTHDIAPQSTRIYPGRPKRGDVISVGGLFRRGLW
ncbi:hypothetical protein Pa4123_23480 [Phytohabitans aurantiacus]|uniref:Uncharacterized protein n=1 Tax=Phytohabitans aurantiacus TaxID=3016789 RepID=A0ABQ5QRQ4_9ACTN|nr:hypothetical protein Pa4123_23480 [Phytohabitans aurantiacus]